MLPKGFAFNQPKWEMKKRYQVQEAYSIVMICVTILQFHYVNHDFDRADPDKV